MNSMNIRQMIGATLVRAGQVLIGKQNNIANSIVFRNPFSAVLVRRLGVKMEPRVIKHVSGFNDVTIVGKNHMLDVTFGNSTPVTQIDPWYIGLINNSPSPVLAEADTLSSHSGWTEWTSYSGNRKTWVDANAASKIKGTTTVATFTQSASGTLYGILVASASSGTSGILWATGAFDETVDVVNGDDLKVSYGIRT